MCGLPRVMKCQNLNKSRTRFEQFIKRIFVFDFLLKLELGLRRSCLARSLCFKGSLVLCVMSSRMTAVIMRHLFDFQTLFQFYMIWCSS